MTPAAAIEDAPPARLRGGLLMAWVGFWLLMTAVAVQEELHDGGTALLRPVLGETTSALAATVVAVLQWRLAARLDALLAQPWRWFARVLAWLPVAALGFVALTYALRFGLFELLAVPYRRPPWAATLLYESLRFSVFYLLFSGVLFGIRSHLAWHAERLRAEREARLSQEARLLQLAQQLQPHFLFNALNTVSSLIHTDPHAADALLTRLAVLLRAATDVEHRPQQTLAEELALLESYGAIMWERYADRVEIAWSIDDAARRCRVPTLALQPLLENCFRHVVEKRHATTRIAVRATCGGGRLRVAVEDDGDTLAAAPRFGTGLGNVQQRLQALHGTQARVSLEPRAGGGTVAALELPCAC